LKKKTLACLTTASVHLQTNNNQLLAYIHGLTETEFIILNEGKQKKNLLCSNLLLPLEDDQCPGASPIFSIPYKFES